MTWNEPITLHQDQDDAAPHIVEMMAERLKRRKIRIIRVYRVSG